jgi:hypothetical protein
VDELVDTDLEYMRGDPVILRVVQHRFPYVRDDGAAVEKAGRPDGWRAVAEQVGKELAVNVSRGGVVSLPVVPAGPGLDAIVERVADASQTLYQELLDLDAD